MGSLTSAEAHALDGINPSVMLDQVLAWSAINSGSGNHDGLARMAAELAQAFATLPGKVTLAPGDTSETIDANGAIVTRRHGDHLVLHVRRDAPLQLLLTGHMDTVYGTDHPFQSTRWLDATRLNGPGVADMKGGLAIMLAALLAFERHPAASTVGYAVLIDSDEEVGSPSSARLIRTLCDGRRAALTYEPALPDGTLAGARGGSGNFAIRVRGRSAHAGRNPGDGRNALVAAADLAMRLKAATRDGLAVNPARIEGGAPNNVVPDLAILHVNLRPRQPADMAAADALVAAECDAVAHAHDVTIDRIGGFGRPPKPVDPGTRRLQALVEDCGSALGQPIAWRDSGGVCDGNNIAAMGVPVVDTMGARGGAIHSPDEYLIVDSLAERAALSALTLIRLATGGA